MWSLVFFVNCVCLGIGLAMDAFSVSLANGLNEPDMKKTKAIGISGIFAVFQAVMPLIGWVCVHTVIQYFKTFEKIIPFIALVLLSFIGGKMLYDGLKKKETSKSNHSLGLSMVLVEGVATSIDALSVGFTIANYDLMHALIATLIIGLLTFGICLCGILIGKKFGNKIANKATIFGGIILIIIGLEIFITGII